MKYKLSPWYDRETKPFHVGVYSVTETGWYAYWNGEKWGPYRESKRQAAKDALSIPVIGSFQSKKWRGIIK